MGFSDFVYDGVRLEKSEGVPVATSYGATLGFYESTLLEKNWENKLVLSKVRHLV